MLQNALRTSVQNRGTALSRILFTKRVLHHWIGKQLYLLLYRFFKYTFESRELNNLSAYLHVDGVVLDIGANVGVTTAFFSRMVGPSGRVLAFEPDPIMAELFRFHMKQRKKNNVRLFSTALGEQDGSAILFQNSSNRADNRLVLDLDTMSHTEQISIGMRSISSLAAESPELFVNVDFIKIDVQGYETQVILGMRDWLNGLTQKPIIHMEVWPYGLKKAGSSAEELLSLCSQVGYIVGSDTRQQAKNLESSNAYMDITLIPQA